MRKLADLVTFLRELNLVASEQIDSDFDIEEYEPKGDYIFNESHNGVCSADVVYSANIKIERLSARYDAAYILTLVSFWLLDNDPIRYRNKIQRGGNNELIPLDPPTIIPLVRDDETIDMELTVPFREPLFAIESVNGTLPFNGVMYRLADYNNPDERFEENYILAR